MLKNKANTMENIMDTKIIPIIKVEKEI